MSPKLDPKYKFECHICWKRLLSLSEFMLHLSVHHDVKSEDEGYSESEKTEPMAEESFEVERKVRTEDGDAFANVRTEFFIEVEDEKVIITEESCKEDVKVEGFIEGQSNKVMLDKYIEDVKIEGFIKAEGQIVKTEECMEEEKTNDTIIEVYHYRGTTSSSEVYKLSFFEMLRSQALFHLALQDSHPHLSDFLHSTTTSSTSSNKSNSSSSNGIESAAPPPHITFSQEQIDCICDSLQQRGDIKRLDSFLKSYQGHMT